MEEDVRSLVDAQWEDRLGVSRSVLRSGGVYVVDADLGANDAMSFLFDETCIVVVPEDHLDAARASLDGLDARAAFTVEALRTLVGHDARVDGPSCHLYADARSFLGAPDDAAVCVGGGDPALLGFLEGQDLADWSESGFPREPSAADPATTRFWLLAEGDRILAAGNMTEWRRLAADVGVLTARAERGRGVARRLVGAMVGAALPDVGVARYRALASNTASLSVARHLGFEEYGQNFRARRPIG